MEMTTSIRLFTDKARLVMPLRIVVLDPVRA